MRKERFTFADKPDMPKKDTSHLGRIAFWLTIGVFLAMGLATCVFR